MNKLLLPRDIAPWSSDVELFRKNEDNFTYILLSVDDLVIVSSSDSIIITKDDDLEKIIRNRFYNKKEMVKLT